MRKTLKIILAGAFCFFVAPVVCLMAVVGIIVGYFWYFFMLAFYVGSGMGLRHLSRISLHRAKKNINLKPMPGGVPPSWMVGAKKGES